MRIRFASAFTSLCLAFFLATAPNSQAIAQDSPTEIAQTIELLSQNATSQSASGASQDAYDAAILLERLLRDFPESLESRLVRLRGRLPNSTTDLGMVHALALQWMQANPGLPQFSLPDSVTQIALALPRGEASLGAASSASTEARPSPSAPMAPPAAPSLDLSLLSGGSAPLRPRAGSTATQNLDGTEPLPRSQLNRALRGSTVLVIYSTVSATGSITPQHIGTGSLIGPDLVLTNAHVAESFYAARNGGGIFLILNEHIGAYRASIVSIARRDTPMNIDAAVLRVVGLQASEWLHFQPQSLLDEAVMIAGYPGDAVFDDRRYDELMAGISVGFVPNRRDLPTALVNDGRINNLIRSEDNGSIELQYAMVTAQGNSGSPVINMCGDIVGLHYRRNNPNADVQYNSAVTSRDVLAFLSLAGLPASIDEGPCQSEE